MPVAVTKAITIKAWENEKCFVCSKARQISTAVLGCHFEQHYFCKHLEVPDSQCVMCWHMQPMTQIMYAGGFAFGYGVSKAAGLPEKAARTNSIEVSCMQPQIIESLFQYHLTQLTPTARLQLNTTQGPAYAMLVLHSAAVTSVAYRPCVQLSPAMLDVVYLI